MCVCSWVCKWLSSGFIRLQWCLDSRKSSTNRTEWCRNGQKAPLEFLKLIFSPFTLSLCFNHSLTHSLTPPFHSSLHQHRSAFSALAVTQPRCCSTNFSHPFIPAILPFPKSTLSQRGEAFSLWLLLHSNFCLFCSSFCLFHKSFILSFFSTTAISLSFLHLPTILSLSFLTGLLSVCCHLSISPLFIYLAMTKKYFNTCIIVSCTRYSLIPNLFYFCKLFILWVFLPLLWHRWETGNSGERQVGIRQHTYLLLGFEHGFCCLGHIHPCGLHPIAPLCILNQQYPMIWVKHGGLQPQSAMG